MKRSQSVFGVRCANEGSHYGKLKFAVEEMIPDLGNSIKMFKGLVKAMLAKGKD